MDRTVAGGALISIWAVVVMGFILWMGVELMCAVLKAEDVSC